MNKETIELIKQYIIETVSNNNSINKEAYELLTHMLKTDRTFANAMHDTYNQLECMGSRYTLRSFDQEDM